MNVRLAHSLEIGSTIIAMVGLCAVIIVSGILGMGSYLRVEALSAMDALFVGIRGVLYLTTSAVVVRFAWRAREAVPSVRDMTYLYMAVVLLAVGAAIPEPGFWTGELALFGPTWSMRFIGVLTAAAWLYAAEGLASED